jgi:hypothetical protein
MILCVSTSSIGLRNLTSSCHRETYTELLDTHLMKNTFNAQS